MKDFTVRRALVVGALALAATGCGSSASSAGPGHQGGEGGSAGGGDGAPGDLTGADSGGADDGGQGAVAADGGSGATDAGREGAVEASTTSDAAAAAMGLHVVMGAGGMPGKIVDSSGSPVQLHGADRSGTEYACVQGWGIFDGPSDQASIDAMKAWHINAVRVPLNEDCWLGINGVMTQYGGTSYQQAVATYVNLLTSNGMIVILDLHWTAPGTESATGQLPMADADHSPTFWSQVAAAYANDGSVIFDLFNEPYITDWGCWVSGGSCAKDSKGNSYTVAGMASLLKAVRGAGAENVVILGGLGYSSDFSSWVTSVNSIPGLAAPLGGISIANVAASAHIYDFGNTGCPSQYNNYSGTCDSAQTTAANGSIPSVLSAGFPLVMGESGISAYQSSTPFTAAQIQGLETWYDNLLSWVEIEGQGYLAWDWNTSGSPYLLTDYTGTPTPDFGVTYQDHLKKF